MPSFPLSSDPIWVSWKVSPSVWWWMWVWISEALWSTCFSSVMLRVIWSTMANCKELGRASAISGALSCRRQSSMPPKAVPVQRPGVQFIPPAHFLMFPDHDIRSWTWFLNLLMKIPAYQIFHLWERPEIVPLGQIMLPDVALSIIWVNNPLSIEWEGSSKEQSMVNYALAWGRLKYDTSFLRVWLNLKTSKTDLTSKQTDRQTLSGNVLSPFIQERQKKRTQDLYITVSHTLDNVHMDKFKPPVLVLQRTILSSECTGVPQEPWA